MGCIKPVVTIGETYGGVEVVYFCGSHPKTHKRFYICKCVTCGKEAPRAASKIASGRLGGCMRCARITHGLSHTDLYSIAHGVQERITNPDCISFSSHGGRGIELYPGWHGPDGLIRMVRWLEDNLPPWRPGLTLDRINNDGNYEPGNLRWATASQQANNRRNNRRITWRGRTQNLIEWSREVGIPRDTLTWRINAGWSLDRAMAEPVGRNGRRGWRAKGRA